MKLDDMPRDEATILLKKVFRIMCKHYYDHDLILERMAAAFGLAAWRIEIRIKSGREMIHD